MEPGVLSGLLRRRRWGCVAGRPGCLVPSRSPWRRVGIPGMTATSQSLRQRLQLRYGELLSAWLPR
eukprot:14500298-Alexandrium_andersonii.AAC.1